MDVTNDSASFAQPRRIEILKGPERRRSWSDMAKIAIVAEALAPGAVVSEVGRPNGPMFVPAIVEAAKQPSEPDCEAPVPASIEIRVGAVTVRIEGGRRYQDGIDRHQSA